MNKKLPENAVKVSEERRLAIAKANELTRETQRQHRFIKYDGFWYVYDAVLTK